MSTEKEVHITWVAARTHDGRFYHQPVIRETGALVADVMSVSLGTGIDEIGRLTMTVLQMPPWPAVVMKGDDS